MNDRVHAALLDEGLEVVAGLWSGQPFDHEGVFSTIRDALVLPAPVHTPRIPIWVAGIWPHKTPIRRAVRWDGVCPIVEGQMMQPEAAHDMLTLIRQYRPTDAPSTWF